MIEPFTINIPDAVLDDLKSRLRRTRFAADFGNEAWDYGANGTYLQELLHYWAEDYDWRAQERAMNGFSHFRTVIDNVPIHFIHERGRGPNPVPLIMSHGWPWTFWDLQKVIRPLTDPASFGGDAADAFDVIIPSLPGFGFSTPLTTPGVNFSRTADMWVRLMQRLGYETFAAQGGDFGAFVTAQLGHKYADRMLGVHVHLAGPLGMISGNMPDALMFGPGEESWQAANAAFFDQESAYSRLQSTKPQTLAYGLNDSPAGLCAWILEKRRRWSDCGGEVERRFSKDDLCTTMTLYWVTQSIGTSARFYAEARRRPWTPSHDRQPVVEAPTAVLLFENDIVKLPRRWAEGYYNLQRWNVAQTGGHFAPMEEPGILVQDLRDFFRTLRSTKSA
jgi:pimeloyl-ACP methyl ester carboxylesterase